MRAVLEAPGPSTGAPLDGVPRRERTVLVVDDSAEDRRAIGRFLAQDAETRYRVLEAATGEEGLEHCRAGGVDAVLLDYDLPNLNGLQLLARLREATGGAARAEAAGDAPPFAVVVLTGRGSELVAVQALKQGAHDYPVKGHYTAEGLRRTVDDALAKVATVRELEGQRRELERLYEEARRANHEKDVALGGLRRAEREAQRRADDLAAANRQKDEFLAMLAHELRNPLAPIRTAMKVIARKGGGDATLVETCGMVETQVGHLARLIEDLLDVSRVTRGKVLLQRTAVDAAAAVRRVTENKRHHFDERNHEVVVSVATPPGGLWLDADEVRVQQILGNLLTNAAKYTDPGGRIEVSAGAEGDEVVFRVRDNGLGITADLLPRLFDLFVQGQRSIARSEGGLGIGLTLVKSLAEMHGGTVAVSSDGPGRGSEFTVRLPRGVAPASAAVPAAPGPEDAGPAPAPPAGGDGAAARLLVVDDNVEAARTLAMFFEVGGLAVTVAHDGPAALDAAADGPFDVVVLDIGLPGMDGYEVARRLRAGSGAAALLVAVTGYDQERHRERSRDAGFDIHLVKPVDLDVLERVVLDHQARRVAAAAA